MVIPFRYQHPLRMNLQPYVESDNLTASNLSAAAVTMFGASSTEEEESGGFSSRAGLIVGICLGAGVIYIVKVSQVSQSVTTLSHPTPKNTIQKVSEVDLLCHRSFPL